MVRKEQRSVRRLRVPGTLSGILLVTVISQLTNRKRRVGLPDVFPIRTLLLGHSALYALLWFGSEVRRDPCVRAWTVGNFSDTLYKCRYSDEEKKTEALWT